MHPEHLKQEIKPKEKLTMEKMLGIMERLKPFPRPKEWTRMPKNTSTVQGKINDITLDLNLSVARSVGYAVDLGWGRQVIGTVAGREDEDAKIGIDALSEEYAKRRLIKLAKKNGELSLFVFSEHQNIATGIKKGKSPEIVGSEDPYDNSDEAERGIDTPGHFVIGFYDLDGNPIAAGDTNLFTQHISLNINGKNYQYNPKIGLFQETPIPPAIETIKDPRFAYASYFGRDKYSRPFNENFDVLNKNRHPKSTFHPKGGAHIYEQMARGAIHAYIMFGEPISEILQGLPFILSAEFVALSVRPDGSYEHFKVDPPYYLEHPERYNEDRIRLFVAARTIQLAEEIIGYAYPKYYQI